MKLTKMVYSVKCPACYSLVIYLNKNKAQFVGIYYDKAKSFDLEHFQ